MKKTLTLFKVQFKSMFSFSSLKTDKKQRRKLLGYLVLILCLAPTYYLYFSIVDIVYGSLAALNQQSALLAVGVMGISAIILMFGFMYVFSTLFGARDLDMLLAMPIKSGNIAVAKLLNLVVFEYIIVIPLLLPILIMYGSLAGAGVLYWIYAVIMLIFVPVIPISLAAVIDVIIVRMFSMRFNVEKIQTAFMVVFLIVMLAFSFATNRMSSAMYSDEQAQVITDMIQDNGYLINTLTKVYPPARLFATALNSSEPLGGALNLLAFVGASLIAFAFASFVCDKLYINAVTNGINNAKQKDKKISAAAKQKAYDVNSKAISIFSVDMKVMLRTPVFAFNLLLIIPLLPAVILISFISQGVNISAIFDFLKMVGPVLGTYLMVGCVFVATMITMTSSSFSREGRAIWLTQIIPAKPAEQLIGRCLGTVFASLFLCTALMVLAGVFGSWNAVYIIAMIIVSTAASIPISIIGLLIDARNPKTDWEDATTAVKRNGNVVISTFISMANSVLLGVIVFLMSSLNVWITLATVFIISVLLTLLLSKLYILKSPSMLQNK